MDQRFTLGRGMAIPRRKTADREMTVVYADTGGRSGDAIARFKRLCEDAAIEAKVDRAVKLTERIAARRAAPIPDHPGAGPCLSEMVSSPGPSADQMAAQWRASYEARQTQICAEAEAAYAARNPHKMEGQQ